MDDFMPLEMTPEDEQVLASVQPGDRLFLRDGRLARMDEPTFTRHLESAFKAACRTAIHSLNADASQLDSCEIAPMTPLSASISVTVALEDGRKATASAELWPSRNLH